MNSRFHFFLEEIIFIKANQNIQPLKKGGKFVLKKDPKNKVFLNLMIFVYFYFISFTSGGNKKR